MSNLFAVFDPESWFSLNLSWFVLAFPLLALPGAYWARAGKLHATIYTTLSAVSSEFKAILGPFQAPGTKWVLVTLFFAIALMNLWGMIPYVFTATSHPAIACSLALPLWLGANLRSMMIQPNFMLDHLIPKGTPPALVPFMALIELLSSLMRPLTLAIRLTANMVAGHLLFALVGGQASVSSIVSTIGVTCVLFMLALLELSVALIQAFVFSLLNTLYVHELQTFSLANAKPVCFGNL